MFSLFAWTDYYSKNIKTKSVYLPGQTINYDKNIKTISVYLPGQTINCDKNINKISVYLPGQTIMFMAFGQRLASRIYKVGKNGALASKRRQWWSREEEMAKVDREAAWLEKVQGQNIISRGRFWRGAGNR